MNLLVSLTRMPLLSPFSNSAGSMRTRTAMILRLSHEGVEAFSECVTDESPSCTGEDNVTALHDIKRRLAGAIREGPPEPAEFLGAVEGVRGSQMAKAALEMLLWDYAAKARGVPLDSALGEPKGRAPSGIAIGLGAREEVRAQIEAALRQGYRRVKVKVERAGALEELGWIRALFAEAPLSADANGCFDLRKDIETLKKIDDFSLEYLEQPLGFDDLRGHSSLSEKVSTPICLDESVTTLERAEEALDIGAASVINIKPGRVGGLTVAMEIARLARGRGAHVWVGGMLETGVGRAFNVALASQRRIDYPGDTSPNDRYFQRDVVKNPFKMEGGLLRPNRGPGIGVELDRELLSAVTIKNWEIF